MSSKVAPFASRVARLVAVLLLGIGLTGCGAIRFQRAWSSAGETAAESGVDGRWKGSWHSHWNGHSGGLRGLLEARDGGRIHAWFFSTYGGILFFQNEVLFQGSPGDEGRIRFEGEQDLGKAIGGVYHYRGLVEGDRFHAHYRAENGDHGVFEMRRVAKRDG